MTSQIPADESGQAETIVSPASGVSMAPRKAPITWAEFMIPRRSARTWAELLALMMEDCAAILRGDVILPEELLQRDDVLECDGSPPVLYMPDSVDEADLVDSVQLEEPWVVEEISANIVAPPVRQVAEAWEKSHSQPITPTDTPACPRVCRAPSFYERLTESLKERP